MRSSHLVLLTIFTVGLVLRFYQLGDVPIGLHRDEAFLGYNAYSILKTGRDMSGHLLPLHLESFLYSPAGYSYLSGPFIWIFGLNAFSVRFASALFGSLTILVTYFLTKQFFSKFPIAEIAAFLLAISPWHINLSRTATENVIAVSLISLGTLSFMSWVRKKRIFHLVLSFLLFGSTLLVYQAPRSFLPLFIPLLIVLFQSTKKRRKEMFFSLILFFSIIVIPVFLILSSRNLSLRIRTVSIFATDETQLVLDQHIREDGVSLIPPLTARAFHNKAVGYSSQFLKNYVSHFSYDFLFTDQAFPDRYRIPLMGIMYIFELPLLLTGVWYLIKEKRKEGAFLLGWIVIAPIGSALAFDDVPNVQRTLVAFPALPIVCAVGVNTFKNWLSRQHVLVKKTAVAFFILAMLYSITFYLHQYYIHGKRYRPWYRQDGYKDLVVKVNRLLPTFKKAVITDRESSPTIFFLFYMRYDPSLFQLQTARSAFRGFDRIAFGNYEFSQDECPLRFDPQTQTFTGERNILYVNSALCKKREGIRVLETIKRSDDSDVFQLSVLD